MLKLYHAEPAANSLKALISFKEKGIPFESVYVDLHKFEQHEPAFVALNPEGQVPVLVHDGQIITHTTVIAEYLEDAFPDAPSLRPADALGKARMRYWTKFCDEHVLNYVSMHGWHRMITVLARSIEGGEFEKLMARIPLHEQRGEMADGALGVQRGGSCQCHTQDRGGGRQGGEAAGARHPGWLEASTRSRTSTSSPSGVWRWIGCSRS